MFSGSHEQGDPSEMGSEVQCNTQTHCTDWLPMERVQESDLHMKMEALVQDLSTALEESSRASSVRRRWGLRRRARSTGSLPAATNHKTQSDDSTSSVDPAFSRDRGMSSLHQSDSDDAGPTAGVHRQLTPFSLQARHVPLLHGNIESDSFNENFSPVHPSTRRKRKFKRMAVDVVDAGVDSAGAGHASLPVPLAAGKKKRSVRHVANCENRYGNLVCGKRKRSMRERSVDCSGERRGSRGGQVEGRRGAGHGRQLLRPPQPLTPALTGARAAAVADVPSTSRGVLGLPPMDVDGGLEVAQCDMVSSSSISSSESETGVCTNDEGREGDDEQSDWFGGEHGHGWWEDDEGPPGAVGGADDDDCGEEDPTFKAILCGSFEHLSEEAKESYRAHVRFLRQGINGCREIRGGRRRVRNERPGFSISTSANEKLSRFLQDPAQMELKLHPMKQQERDQLCQLATLYSLKMSTDPTLTCPVLTKTRNTMQAVRVEQVALGRFHPASRHHQHHLSDFKKRRKMPQPMELVGAGASPIPDSNIGNTMLRNMGWEPGKGLGAHSSGITEPVPAAIRPKYQGLGLGHACTSS
ncbi:G patch domain-containing protein 2 isoform X1 [Schistocerca piceifrons]|uniref:G patch domain-containing protein 2 isoform X1 n=2 Tax=Schistocerca piceifrons TaxID=274613 RepID=UPI001F5F6C0F|nr:G patch domain-containing protein 2 isoform X1 [Schistocerca piceifrons]